MTNPRVYRIKETKELLKIGYSKPRIAAELGVSVKTVEDYIAEIKAYEEKEEAEEKIKLYRSKEIKRQFLELKKNNQFYYYLVELRWLCLIIGIFTISLGVGILFIIASIIGFKKYPKLNNLKSKISFKNKKDPQKVYCPICNHLLGIFTFKEFSKSSRSCSFCGINFKPQEINLE